MSIFTLQIKILFLILSLYKSISIKVIHMA